MPLPTLSFTAFSNIRRRTRTYDAKADQSAQLDELLAYVQSEYVTSVDVGDLKPTIRATAPAGWLICDGSPFDAATYPELAAALGGAVLPDFRDRFPIGAGGLAGLLATGGTGTFTITAANMPAHTHTVNDPGHTHGINDPGHSHMTDRAGGAAAAGAGANGLVNDQTDRATTNIGIRPATTGITVNPTGAANPAPITVTPPFIGINWMVKT